MNKIIYIILLFASSYIDAQTAPSSTFEVGQNVYLAGQDIYFVTKLPVASDGSKAVLYVTLFDRSGDAKNTAIYQTSDIVTTSAYRLPDKLKGGTYVLTAHVLSDDMTSIVHEHAIPIHILDGNSNDYFTFSNISECVPYDKSVPLSKYIHSTVSMLTADERESKFKQIENCLQVHPTFSAGNLSSSENTVTLYDLTEDAICKGMLNQVHNYVAINQSYKLYVQPSFVGESAALKNSLSRSEMCAGQGIAIVSNTNALWNYTNMAYSSNKTGISTKPNYILELPSNTTGLPGYYNIKNSAIAQLHKYLYTQYKKYWWKCIADRTVYRPYIKKTCRGKHGISIQTYMAMHAVEAYRQGTV
jgi:hypothetical protein